VLVCWHFAIEIEKREKLGERERERERVGMGAGVPFRHRVCICSLVFRNILQCICFLYMQGLTSKGLGG
jgi:hypothetical protein